jgi:hypothetical protein
LNTDVLNQGHGYLYRNSGIIETKLNEEFIKNVGIFNRGVFFIKGVSDAIVKWRELGWLRKC